MLIITWDEHGGFYDHVAPPATVPPGDRDYADDANEHGFTFDRLGPRVPAVLVSPLIPRNLIDHRVYDHSTIPATIERVFGLEPLTKRDAGANSLDTLLRCQPRDTPTSLATPDSYRMPPALRISTGGHVARPNTPVDEGEITPHLYSALAQDLEIADPSKHPGLKQRVATIRTWSEAAKYMKDVAARVAAAKRSRPRRLA
jgi:phospholipase C